MSERLFFVIHPAAVEEAEKATRWYRQRRARAAAQFVEEVNDAIDRVGHCVPANFDYGREPW